MEQDQDRVMAYYTAILARSEKMLQSANACAWEELIVQQRDYVRDVERLATIEQDVPLAAEQRAIKLDLLSRIRDNEQQLSELLQERMSRLGALMTRSRNRLRVNKAYVSGGEG